MASLNEIYIKLQNEKLERLKLEEEEDLRLLEMMYSYNKHLNTYFPYIISGNVSKRGIGVMTIRKTNIVGYDKK